MEQQVLNIEHLQMVIGKYPVIDDISLYMNEGEMVALVGESGCGKTMTALAVTGLLPETAHITSGIVQYRNLDITNTNKQSLRGKEIAMIFQEPMTALDPLMSVGKQISETAMIHGMPKKEAKEKALAMMKAVGLRDEESLYRQYPHVLSGGMRQRIMIALALINNPSLLIADEPTTALDVTIQAEIMSLLQTMNQTLGTGILLITHDLTVVKQVCQRVYIMYAGKIMEEGKTSEVFACPSHPYTEGLLSSIPDISQKGHDLMSIPGNVKSLQDRSNVGCPFYDRCTKRIDACKTYDCHLVQVEGSHRSACILQERRGFNQNE